MASTFNLWLDHPTTSIALSSTSNQFDSRRNSSIISISHTKPAVESALSKVATAVAHLRRSGSIYRKASEAFWPFCAGSWSREEFDAQVRESGKRYVSRYQVRAWEDGMRMNELMNFEHRIRMQCPWSSVEEDLKSAKREIAVAVALLRKVDERDAEDLLECVDACGVW